MKSLLNHNEEQISRPDWPRYSLEQGIIYTVTKGRTLKNIVSSRVKNFTNNTKVISILNCLGYGVSNSLLMEAQTENALGILDN